MKKLTKQEVVRIAVLSRMPDAAFEAVFCYADRMGKIETAENLYKKGYNVFQILDELNKNL